MINNKTQVKMGKGSQLMLRDQGERDADWEETKLLTNDFVVYG